MAHPRDADLSDRRLCRPLDRLSPAVKPLTCHLSWANTVTIAGSCHFLYSATYPNLTQENPVGFVTDIKIASNGRMVLPAAVREALGLRGEGRLILTVDGDEVRLSPISHVVARVQSLYRENVKHDATSDEFLEERRRDDRAETASR